MQRHEKSCIEVRNTYITVVVKLGLDEFLSGRPRINFK